MNTAAVVGTLIYSAMWRSRHNPTKKLFFSLIVSLSKNKKTSKEKLKQKYTTKSQVYARSSQVFHLILNMTVVLAKKLIRYHKWKGIAAGIVSFLKVNFEASIARNLEEHTRKNKDRRRPINSETS